MAQELTSVLPSLGSALGAGVAQPINQALDLLAQQKLAQLQEATQSRMLAQQAAQQQAAAQMERQRYAQGLTPLVGEQAALFLSNLDPAERKYALQNLSSLGQLTGAQPQTQEGLAALAPWQQAHYKEGKLAGIETIPGRETEALAAKQSQVQEPSREKLIEDIFTSPAEKRQREQLRLAQEKLGFQKEQAAKQFEQKEKFGSFKETKPERKEIVHAASAARENLARLDRMEELSKKGDLNNPLYLELLKKIGLDVEALKTPDTQEFGKLTQDFLRDAKNVFGARVTNYDVQAFLKAIPSLSQSTEGRERVINNLKIFNQAALAKAQAMKEIIKENKGVPPLDLIEQVEEKSAPKIDNLFKKMNFGSAKVGTKLSDVNTENIPVNTIATNPKTGEKKKWTGTEWIAI